MIKIMHEYPNLMIGENFAYLFNKDNIKKPWKFLSAFEYDELADRFLVEAFNKKFGGYEEKEINFANAFYAYQIYDEEDIDDVTRFLARIQRMSDVRAAHIVQMRGYELVPYIKHQQYGVLTQRATESYLHGHCSLNGTGTLFLFWDGLGNCAISERKPFYDPKTLRWIIPSITEDPYPYIKGLPSLYGRKRGENALYEFSSVGPKLKQLID